MKLLTPDYRDADPEEAVQDFHERRKKYESVYAPLGDDESNLSYIKVLNCTKFVINNIRGYLPLKVRKTSFLYFCLLFLKL